MLRVAVLLFLASFHIRRVAGCGGELTSSSGQITSPNYPNQYPPNSQCDYTIRTEPDTLVSLKFLHFTLEAKGGTVYDWLEIHDGDTIVARELGRFYGRSLPPEIRSSQNSLFLRFRADGSNEYSGFLAIYSTIWLIPPSVKNVSVTPMSSSSVRVHWESPHPSVTVDNYTVTVKPLARRHSPPPGCPALPPLHSAISVTVNGSTTETDIHLPKDVEFQVSVRAALSDSLSLPSDVVSGYTLAEASEPVRDLSADLRDRVDRVTLTWKAPCDTGGVLSHFIVILEPNRKRQNAHNYILNQTVTQPPQESYSISTLLSHLTAECEYNVTVIPVGLTGLYGANQSTSFQVPARVPTQPLNVSAYALSRYAVCVRWEPPTERHGSLTLYTVTLQPIAKPHSFDPPQHIAVVTVNASTLETDINHLLADTEFQVSVTAATSAGQGPPSVTFLVHTPSEAEVPTPPQNVSAAALSTSSVRVQWEPPTENHGTLTSYIVSLQPVVRQQSPSVLPKRKVAVSGSTLQTDIHDLVAGTDFQVTVMAATSVGQGPPSAPSVVHTPSESKIPLQPQNVSATALSHSQVIVRWEPPAESTGTLITSYIVTLQPLAHPYTPLSHLHMAVVNISGSSFETNINYLLAETEFQVTVTAVTAAGQGPPSAPILVQTLREEKVPSPPQSVSATALSSSAVRVKWEPPAMVDGNLTSYTVTLQPVTHPNAHLSMAVMAVSGSSFATTINHLLAETEFQVTVTAVTAAGQGPPSAPILVQTLREDKVPSPPQSVSATALSSSAVRVKWEPPAMVDGNLTSYTVTLQPVTHPNAHLSMAVMAVSGSSFATTINHLLAETEFQVTVTAVTAAGQGPPSAPILVQTLREDKVPSPPQRVSATALSSSAVRVKWEPPAMVDGNLTSYTVTLHPVTHPNSHLSTALMAVSGSTLEININYLQPDTKFLVTVTAVTAAGKGPPSAPTLVHTLLEANPCHGGAVLVPWVLAGVATAGLVFFFVKRTVAQRRKNTITCNNQQAESQHELAMDDLQCD